jgi:hypothetical protein
LSAGTFANVDFVPVAEDGDTRADFESRPVVIIKNGQEMSMIEKILDGKVSPVLRDDWGDLEEIVRTGDYS